MPIRNSVGSGGRNDSSDVRTVQDLLNRQGNTRYSYGRIAVDGVCGSQTIGAIRNYQQRVVGFSAPDGRVDPGGQTLTALERNASGASAGASSNGDGGSSGVRVSRPTEVAITVTHGGVRPKTTNSTEGSVRLESSFRMTGQGGPALMLTGSVWPDDMSQYGHIQDGTYVVALGFHRPSGCVVPDVPGPQHLVVAYGGFRPVLKVNFGNRVPITSDNRGITTSARIHIHNAAQGTGQRGSNGCLTIKYDQWASFITPFLEAFPDPLSWYAWKNSEEIDWNGGLAVGEVSIRRS